MADVVQTITSSNGINTVQAQASSIPDTVTTVVPPTTFVFWAGFDGTNNMKSDPSYSGDAQSTAVGAMYDQIVKADSINSKAKYYEGVGTPGTNLGSSVLPTTQAIATAQAAYNDFASSAALWLQDNPGGAVTAMMATFSRGSIAGAIFSQMLYEKGLVTADGTELVPPGEVGVSAGLIISPVNTFGDGNLAFAPNVQNMTEIIAQNEYRYEFEQEIYPGMSVIEVTGNHGDAGSFYPDGLGSVYLEQYTNFFNAASPGMIDPVFPSRQYTGGPLDIHVESASLANPQNLAYATVDPTAVDQVRARTVEHSQAATTDITSTGDITTFVNYKGDTVVERRVAGILQSVEVTTPVVVNDIVVDRTTTVYQTKNPLTQVTLDGDGGSTIVKIYNGSGVLAQTTTTMPSGEIERISFNANGDPISVTRSVASAIDGSKTVSLYDATGSVLKSSITTNIVEDSAGYVTTTINKYNGSGVLTDSTKVVQDLFENTVTTTKINMVGGEFVGSSVRTKNLTTGSISQDEYDANDKQLSSIVKLKSGEVDETLFTDGVATWVSKKSIDPVTGASAYDTYDGSGMVLQSSMLTQYSSSYNATTGYSINSNTITVSDGEGNVSWKAVTDQYTDASSHLLGTMSTAYVSGVLNSQTVETTIHGNKVNVSYSYDESGQPVVHVNSINGAAPTDQEKADAAFASLGVTPDSLVHGEEGVVGLGVNSVVSKYDKTGTAAYNLQQNLNSVSDALSLMKAIQSGKTLPMVSSGLKLSNDLYQNSTHLTSTYLSGASSIASGYLSLLSLEDSLKKHDDIATVTYTAQVVNYGATAYANYLGYTTDRSGGAVAKAFGSDSAIAQLGPALSYLNLINDISHGDETAVAMDVLMICAPEVGVPLQIALTVFSMFDTHKVPATWGNGHYVWNDIRPPVVELIPNSGDATGSDTIGTVTISDTLVGEGVPYTGPWTDYTTVAKAIGESGGDQAVDSLMNAVLASMNSMITTAQAQNPGFALGLIPNRMPGLVYDQSGFRFTNIDPLTGVEKNPFLRFDTHGNPYNAVPGSPESYMSLGEALITSALNRGAIAPEWEVRTAGEQTNAGDPQAGLTEEERAARAGDLAPAQAGDSQIWRPVVLDLNGDGIQKVSQVQSGVAFNVDDSGYLKGTEWINSNDAFLVLDRDYNGQIDSSREMLSNGKVGLNHRGVNGLAWMDSNYDGTLDSFDPVFNELRVWRDINGNGVEEAGEETNLSQNGITSLNYAMGQFIINGQTQQMASPDLAADTAGERFNIIPEGIVLQNSNGQTSLLVTSVDDLTQVQANADGLKGIENLEMLVNSSDLLANDTFGGFTGRDLTFGAALNFRHGTGFVDVNNIVHFTPETNYFGNEAGFDYTTIAPNGQAGSGQVIINVEHVNQKPSEGTVDHTTRAVYAYTPVKSYVDDYGATQYVSGGDPIYEPCVITTVSRYGWGGPIVDYYIQSTPYIVPNSDPNSENYDGSVVTYDYRTTPIAYEDTGAGQVHATDVDDPASSLKYEVYNQPQYGAVSVNADGTFQYTSYKEPGVPSDDIVSDGQQGALKDGTLYTSSNLPGAAINPTSDIFQVKVTDPHGASTIQSITVPHMGPYLPPTPPGGSGGKKPIALDLDQNGFNFTNIHDSNVFFDVNGDGWKHRTSWITGDDGLLVFDANGNGIADDGSEISFTRYLSGAQTDLEGLKAFDSNDDGMFSSLDDKWSKFGVWQDTNQNGVTDVSEFNTLDQMGIASLNLASNHQFSVVDGNTIQGIAQVTMIDGTTRDAADVTLAYSKDVQITNPDGSTSIINNPPPFSPLGLEINGTDKNDLILGKTGNTVIKTGGGNDVVFAGDGNDLIEPGSGNDAIYAGGGDDIVMPGTGNNVIFAGLGNDVLLAKEGNNSMFGEGGNDVIYSGIGNDLLDGGNGNDVLFGGAGDDTISGGANNDALFGSDGDDAMDGGSGYDRLEGGLGDDALDGGEGIDLMLGGAGNDTYWVDNVGDEVNENANIGIDTVNTTISYSLTDNVENLYLSGTDNLTGYGNSLDNIITGNAGNSTLVGADGNDRLASGSGIDTLIGGIGDDTYIVDNIDDKIVENVTEGTDIVYSLVSYSLADNVENMTLTGSADINGTGNVFDNVVIGNSGSNVLDGGAGVDAMIGGVGNDTYVVDNTGDIVTENLNEGIDTVLSSISYALTDNVENLTLTGTDGINGTGNALDNVLLGNSGNNELDGGAGADAMIGGAGDDTYIVDNIHDIVTDSVNEGIDTVLSLISYALTDNVENLTLTGTADINGTGNTLNNVLIGNSGNNVLDGGAGEDAMSGGVGNDTYVVDNAGDVVAENASEGTDTVQSSITYALTDNVENLILTGTADLNGTGNTLDNTLIGNSGNNLLDGGAGGDAMLGGAGNDTYVVDIAGDIVTENANEGIDTVLSSINYALTENVENVTLTGTADLNGTGNTLDNVLNGNSGSNVLDGGAGADAMLGGAGNDTYVVDNIGDIVTDNVNEGIDTVLSSISYALTDNVENLTLIGADDINGAGNILDNVVAGNSGSNVLDGGAGADAMLGGAGNDTYIVDNTGDVVVENASEGADIVYSSVSYSLADNVENMTLTGTADINGTGNALDNKVIGNSGGNVLDGGVGADAMLGGAGNDTYIVDNTGDVVVENANEGADIVYSSVSYSLADNVENMTLTGTADINGTGNVLDNVLLGNSGNNELDGGAGADVMLGGAGNDIYVVDNTGDIVTENTSEGADTVLSSISYALTDNVENLTLTGTDGINGTGNTLGNVLIGNSGNNVLDGGAGADAMLGGGGNDTYVVDNTGDIVTDNVNEGIDIVLSSISYVLTDNVENLILTGTADIDGTGNVLDNILLGNSGNNMLDGGAGADVMMGGAANDIYVVDNVGDIVTENASEGADTVLSSISYALTDNVENLTLTGTADINGTGNTLDNVLTGNSGNNMLNGGGGGNDTFIGGTGNDTLIGAGGNDTYVFNAGDGLDTLTDTGGSNTIRFGEGLTLQNVAVRLTTASGEPFVVGEEGYWDKDDRWEEYGFREGRDDDHVQFKQLNAHLRILDANGNEQSDQGMDFAVMVDRKGNFISPVQSFQFADGSVDTFNDMLIKQQFTDAKKIRGAVVTGRNDDIIYAGPRNTGIWSGTGNDIIYASAAGSQAFGQGGNDFLSGAQGNDTLDGGWGVDILNGGKGNDTLIDMAGNSALLGGEGNDNISSGLGNDFIAGGAGKDNIVTGATRNVVAFNHGDGFDTILASAGAANTLSLGGDIDEDELSFSKNGNDLVLNIGRHGEGMVFKEWYASAANHDFVTLQIIEDVERDYQPHSQNAWRSAKVETFDFAALVSSFDQALASNSKLSKWDLMNGLMDAHLSGSDTAAIGGELAYQYAHENTLADVGVYATQNTLKDSGFGATQALKPFHGLHGDTEIGR